MKMQPLKDQNKIAWPETRICNGCKEIFKAEECTIDIGEFWNVRDDMVYACSDKCAEDAKESWLPTRVID